VRPKRDIYPYFYSMIRSLVTPESNSLQIAIPDDYVGKKVEILVFTHDEATPTIAASTPDVMSQFWGVISEHTTEEMHRHVAQSKAEWEKDI
jgi:hypothetical protein